MYKHLYQHFLDANPGVQHFACHSHHYWPDITRQAMLDYWDDSANRVDEKWDYLFSEKIPAVQQKIAQLLNTGQPQQLVFAPNTHELLFRIISCLDLSKPLRILTTDSEFHSFNRQVTRLEELTNVIVDRVACLPFESFESRFIQQAQQHQYDLTFVSQVFFNSGLAIINLNQLVDAIHQPNSITVIDGYHGFMALPTDLAMIKDKVFYLAGSYKYAQGGEGCCFAHVPQNCQLRPLYTGWFAEFGELDKANSGEVNYATNAMRFAGSTMDFAALYRLDAVLTLFADLSLSIENIHQYVKVLQAAFLQHIESLRHTQLNPDNLLQTDKNHHGHFLTFRLQDNRQVAELALYLKQHNIITDYRGDRLRFGFALYHNVEDYDLGCLQFHQGRDNG
ncbi:aminotransferase class V-fold PLP-dependent enzyme [Neptunicella sp. SCSIO 80796]|uniref:aminotransferase class V-fold PLP-dependent enzyme n=1 Tax=Neptunicella plasticusilytica TaxID=3117012 RepID=UPI003A4E3D8D